MHIAPSRAADMAWRRAHILLTYLLMNILEESGSSKGGPALAIPDRYKFLCWPIQSGPNAPVRTRAAAGSTRAVTSRGMFSQAGAFPFPRQIASKGPLRISARNQQVSSLHGQAQAAQQSAEGFRFPSKASGTGSRSQVEKSRLRSLSAAFRPARDAWESAADQPA